MKNEQQIFARMGLETELLDSGCCGLAGSFGFEREKYEISMTIGERVLLPRVREAQRDTLIITDGFSCREQIMHGTRRKALHLGEVLQMAMRQPLDLRRNEYIETRFVQEEPAYPVLPAALGAGAILAAGWMMTASRKAARQNGDQ
jgi:hypothetical protein